METVHSVSYSVNKMLPAVTPLKKNPKRSLLYKTMSRSMQICQNKVSIMC